MAIQKINLGTEPLGEGGDTYRSANTKINENFSNTEHAASRLVGTGRGNLLEVGELGIGDSKPYGNNIIRSPEDYLTNFDDFKNVSVVGAGGYASWGYPAGIMFKPRSDVAFSLLYTSHAAYSSNKSVRLVCTYKSSKGEENVSSGLLLASGLNAFADSNGFWKTSSPVVRVYSNEIDPNDDAEKQGVTFTRNGVGNYTLHNTLGLAQEGWRLELPQDDNRNPLVAIETEYTKDGGLNIRTYKRIFSMETFTFTCDYDNPLDIPEGRCIDVRLHEIIPEVTDEPVPEEEPLEDEAVEPEVFEEEPSEESE